MNQILVTGAAGFIGFHISKKLLKLGYHVVGVDNLNDYYDPRLKLARLNELGISGVELQSDVIKKYESDKFIFFKADITDDYLWELLATDFNIISIVHLAAQAGVRYSLENPKAYIKSNIEGFLNVLEFGRFNKINHLVYASSSSVYGANTAMPFSIHQNVDHPLSLYAASKKSNELMAHTYSYLYGLPTTGLRFFTVYGPWGRPDMALFKFAKAILAGEPIQVFNYGKHRRDFTYIDDIVEGVIRILNSPAIGNPDWNSGQPDPGTSKAPWRVFNIGNNAPVELMDYISVLEKALGKKAQIELLPLQAGDVKETYANIEDLIEQFHYKPYTTVEDGIDRFVAWYPNYYNA